MAEKPKTAIRSHLKDIIVILRNLVLKVEGEQKYTVEGLLCIARKAMEETTRLK